MIGSRVRRAALVSTGAFAGSFSGRVPSRDRSGACSGVLTTGALASGVLTLGVDSLEAGGVGAETPVLSGRVAPAIGGTDSGRTAGSASRACLWSRFPTSPDGVQEPPRRETSSSAGTNRRIVPALGVRGFTGLQLETMPWPGPSLANQGQTCPGGTPLVVPSPRPELILPDPEMVLWVTGSIAAAAGRRETIRETAAMRLRVSL
jgi:hypothetical protein